MDKYFHELPQTDVDALIKGHKTWGDIMAEYKQPDWCGYPEALGGEFGCWSLVDIRNGGLRTMICPAFCKDCECFLPDPGIQSSRDTR
jgi:hypothetical protein